MSSDERTSGDVLINLVLTYAQSHLPVPARTFLTQYEKQITDSLTRVRLAAKHTSARGWLALAEGRSRDAVSLFRTALPGERDCLPCARAALALAYDAAGESDSTLVIYQALLRYHDPQQPYFVARWEALMLRRSGELYEARAQRPAALASYKAFVELLKDADAELQPQVREFRMRIARLEKEERDRR